MIEDYFFDVGFFCMFCNCSVDFGCSFQVVFVNNV